MQVPAWPRLSVLPLLLLCMILPAWATTYYVATTGSDATPCSSAQSSVTPRRTLGAGMACLAGGDTLTLANDTYTDTDVTTVPSGSVGAPTTIQAATGAQAIIQPSACGVGGGNTVLFNGTSYITLQGPGLIIDGSSCGLQSANGIGIFDPAHHIVLQDIEVRNTNGVGIDFYHYPTDIRITRVKVHDTGRFSTQSPPQAYGMYVDGRRIVIENSEIYNTTGWGIHAYAGSDGTVAQLTLRNNYLHDTNTTNADPNGGGALLIFSPNADGGTPGGHQIYNNVITNCHNTMAAIYFRTDNTPNNLLVNNTIYGCNGGGNGVRVGSGSGGRIQNNILYNNSQNNFNFDAGQGSNVVSANLLGIDPIFVNAVGNNFHLQAGSPAIDVGVNVGVSSDFDGTSRPQGAGFDIGAYEFGTPPPVTATYYLSTTGSDSNTCASAQNVASPKRTLASVLPCMGASSTLYLRGGVYTEVLDTSGQTIPAGASWANPTLIASYPNETATIQNPGVVAPIMWLQNPATDHYIVFDRLVLDGNNFHDANGFVTYPGVDHIRFQNGEIKNTTYEPVLFYQTNQVEILTSQIHNPVQTFAAIAVTGSTDAVIRWNDIFNSAREGIGPKDNQSNTNLEISGNTVHQTGLSTANAALILGPSTNSLIMNNVLFGNAAGINVQTGASGVRLYNNTVTGNTNAGILIDSGASGTLVKNNIVFNNGSAITDNGTGTSQVTNKLTDPLFVNVTLSNYQLQSTSTARDTGTTLTDVQFDFAGLHRPQGAAYDIGAYEFPVTSAPRPPTGLMVAY